MTLFKHYISIINQSKRGCFLFIFVIFEVILSSFNISFAQQTIKFDHITTENGSPNNFISSVIKDHRGYLWIGTFKGLVRYDGNNFKVFKHIPTDSTSISNNRVWAIFEDKEGIIWVGLDHEIGLNSYDYKTETFKAYPIDNKRPESILQNTCFEINQTADGCIWFGGWNGLRILDKKKNTFTYHIKDKTKPNTLLDGGVFDVVEDNIGRVWVFTFGNMAHIYRKETNDFERVRINLDGDYWKKIVKDNDGNFYITCYNGAITKFDPIKRNVVQKFNSKQCLSASYVTSINNSDGNLWFGSDGDGITIFNPVKNSFTSLKMITNSATSISNNVVKSLFRDDSGIIWAGTWNGGLNLYDPQKCKFGMCEYVGDEKQSFSNMPITALYEDSDGKIWIGTDGEGFWLYDKHNNKFSNISQSFNNSLALARIRSICEDNYGNLLLGGANSGMTLFNLKKRTLKSYLSNKSVNTIIRTKTGRIFVGFNVDYNWALQEFDDKNQKFIPKNPIEGLDRNVYGMYEDSNGILWIATGGRGVYSFDYQHDKYSSFLCDLKDKTGPSSNDISVILEDNAHTMWFGNEGSGLDSYNVKTKKWEHYSESNGLLSNVVNGLIEDDKGFLWISTDNGLSRFDPVNKSFVNFDDADGLQKGAFLRNSYLKSKDGEFYFGGSYGLNVCWPQHIIQSTSSPKIHISNLFIGNTKVEPNDSTKILKSPMSITDSITLSYKQNMFAIEYNAMIFSNQRKVNYAYKLEGFNKEWVEVGNEHKAIFTNLDPGVYTFRVKATNADRIWGNEEAVLTITIVPPYWKTLWFNAIVFLSSISIVFAFIKRRIEQEQTIAKLLEAKVKQRTRELEEASALLKENQEEITAQRDSLEVVNGFLLEKQDLIIAQNAELDKHRNSLEKLVEDRTQELELALCKAEESNRLKSSFLANMSHEIRTPMNAIIGFSSLVKDETISESERNFMIDAIGISSASLLVIINDILDLSKIQADQMTLHYKAIDLIDLLEDIYTMFSVEANIKNLLLRLNICQLPQKLIISADTVRLRQVIANLMSNAIKFTSHGEVELGVKEQGSKLVVYVKDTGIGIPAHFGNSIFDRFTKIEDSKDVLYGGTGLGLAISKSLVELWNGKMWYESIENVGSIFYFTIPNAIISRDGSDVADFSTNLLVFPDLVDKTILIAEDQENNFKLLSTYLKRSNANVLRAHNGQEAVSIIKSTVVDLIFMDIKMPVMNGIEATREIRSANIKTPIIAQTAYIFDEEIEEFLDSGMDGYLTKPIVASELIEILKKEFLF